MAEDAIENALKRKAHAAPSLLERETAGVQGSGCRSSFLEVLKAACEINDLADVSADAPVGSHLSEEDRAERLTIQLELDENFERALYLFNKCLQNNAKDWYLRKDGFI